MAIVPLESAVIVGRSERAYKRDGFLELQERVTEEIAAAVVWLFGVDFLQNKFEKVSNAVQKGKNKHLSTNIAWNQAWAKSLHVDLNPQEMFAKNKKEINALLGLKSARWLFSVGTALVAVGYLIPKGNQLKTNFILKHLERRKRSAEGSNVQFGDPNNQKQPNGAQPSNGQNPLPPQRLNRSFAPALPFSVSHAPQSPGSQPNTTTQSQLTNPIASTLLGAQSLTGSNSQSQAVNPFQSKNSPILGQPHLNSVKPNQNNPGVLFSGGIPGLSLVQGMGHLVEQTPYGSILVVDAGIAGGRSYVASKRSPYETAEVLFRDIGSLYFYILCAPQLMKLMTMGLDPVFKSSSHLQPKVADLIHEEIRSKLPTQGLAQILYGVSDEMMDPEAPLCTKMRLADSKAFHGLLQKEAAVYMGSKGLPAEILEALKSHATSAAVMDPGKVQHLLTAIQSGQGHFGQLGNAERQNLGIAVKQAFRHTVGLRPNNNPLNVLDVESIKNSELFKGLFEKLSKDAESANEIPYLLKRIQRMATLDGMNQTHSMMRRSINVMRATLADSPLLQRGDALADFIDKSLHHEQTLEKFLPDQLSNMGEKLHELKLEGQAKQKVLTALGGISDDSLTGLQDALKAATPKQLSKLQTVLTALSDKTSKVEELLPFNTQTSQIQTIKIKVKGMIPFVKSQAVKTHELKESLSGLHKLIDGSADKLTNLKANITGFMSDLTEKATDAEKNLLKSYNEQVHAIIGKGEGRLFSLATQHEDAALGQKLREMLRGGMMNDSKLVSKALDIVGQLETDSRKMPGTGNADKMRKSIEEYAAAMIKRFQQPGMKELTGKALQEALDDFYKLNRNLHFTARGLSLAITMACIGWLVPIMQTKITKHLTGKDKNPGIASAKKQVDDDGTPTPAAKPPAFTAASGIPAWPPNAIKPTAQTAY